MSVDWAVMISGQVMHASSVDDPDDRDRGSESAVASGAIWTVGPEREIPLAPRGVCPCDARRRSGGISFRAGPVLVSKGWSRHAERPTIGSARHVELVSRRNVVPKLPGLECRARRRLGSPRLLGLFLGGLLVALGLLCINRDRRTKRWCAGSPDPVGACAASLRGVGVVSQGHGGRAKPHSPGRSVRLAVGWNGWQVASRPSCDSRGRCWASNLSLRETGCICRSSLCRQRWL